MARTSLPDRPAPGWPAEEFSSAVLPGGLEAWVWRRRGLTNRYAALGARFGAMDARFEAGGENREVPDGTAHFLEHMAFETGQGNALGLFSRLGVRANAFTSPTATVYHFSATDNFWPALRRLVPLVAVSRLTPRGVEDEKRVIAHEIRMYEDSPGSRVHESLLEALYHEHPVRRRVTGTLESIAAITPETLLACHRAFYRPAALAFVAAGDLDPGRVFDVLSREVERSAPAGDPGEVRRILPPEPPLPARPSVEVRMPVQRPRFLVGFKDPALPASDGARALRREVVMDLVVEVVFGRTSPVFGELYRDGLVDAGFSAHYASGPGFGHVAAGGLTVDPARASQGLLEGISRQRQKGIRGAELERKRRKAAGRFASLFDSLEGLATLFLTARLRGLDILEYPAVLRAVTVEEVDAALRDVLTPDQAVVSAVVPADPQGGRS